MLLANVGIGTQYVRGSLPEVRHRKRLCQTQKVARAAGSCECQIRLIDKIDFGCHAADRFLEMREANIRASRNRCYVDVR